MRCGERCNGGGDFRKLNPPVRLGVVAQVPRGLLGDGGSSLAQIVSNGGDDIKKASPLPVTRKIPSRPLQRALRMFHPQAECSSENTQIPPFYGMTKLTRNLDKGEESVMGLWNSIVCARHGVRR